MLLNVSSWFPAWLANMCTEAPITLLVPSNAEPIVVSVLWTPQKQRPSAVAVKELSVAQVFSAERRIVLMYSLLDL